MSKKRSSRKRTAPDQAEPDEVKKDTSPYVYQRENISYSLTIKELPWSEKQKEIINCITDKNTRMVIIRGPAGSAKTIVGVYCGLQLLNNRKISELIITRSAVESGKNKLGYLPGDINEKMNPYLLPIYDKLDELLPAAQVKKLKADERVKITPINFIRGAHMAAKFILVDEVQNSSMSEIELILSRLGEFSKVVLCGDANQIDIPKGQSCINDLINLFNTEECKAHGIYCIDLTEQDVFRGEFCKFITAQFTKYFGR